MIVKQSYYYVEVLCIMYLLNLLKVNTTNIALKRNSHVAVSILFTVLSHKT